LQINIINEFKESTKIEIINIHNQLEKQCESKIHNLELNSQQIQKNLDNCMIKNDSKIDIRICEQQNKDYIFKIEQLNITINNYKKDYNKCQLDLSGMKKDILKIKNEINNLTIKLNTCNLELKNCHGPNKRNCDDSKYDALFVNTIHCTQIIYQ